MLIHEVSKAVGLHPNTIVRFEKLGLIKPQRDWNGWRRYSPEDLDNLRRLLRGEAIKPVGAGKQKGGKTVHSRGGRR
jgi:DNA-binding transcriptional MerR regulator